MESTLLLGWRRLAPVSIVTWLRTRVVCFGEVKEKWKASTDTKTRLWRRAQWSEDWNQAPKNQLSKSSIGQIVSLKDSISWTFNDSSFSKEHPSHGAKRTAKDHRHPNRSLEVCVPQFDFKKGQGNRKKEGLQKGENVPYSHRVRSRKKAISYHQNYVRGARNRTHRTTYVINL